jgi:F0F1-type ATP synthase assembly protein I
MEQEPDKSKTTGNFYKDAAPFIGLGIQLAATVVIMVFLGIWLDNNFSTSPVFVIICSLFGSFAGLYNFIKSTIKSGK